ncbi:type II toxin-antitoxin system HicA family toxin [Agrococcus sp. KRD186]|uniref:type II toxin-antitoxin system HicA family toxin n=1 Tax=Agrococcus sp. KRD186 TaxID=2729730 RepID=UPI0019D23F83|nr:type II toxin-antitoxin system HicA family toxin [Agrococcus sp. KRD186]
MKPQKTRDVLRHLRAIGWVRLRDGRGSHEIWGRPDGSVKFAVPVGHREVSAGVLSQLTATGIEVPREWR